VANFLSLPQTSLNFNASRGGSRLGWFVFWENCLTLIWIFCNILWVNASPGDMKFGIAGPIITVQLSILLKSRDYFCPPG
jgi:hypothetical protein